MRAGWSQLWRDLVAGLLVWIPLIVTIWIVWLVLDRIVLGADRLFNSLYNKLRESDVRLPLMEYLRDVEPQYGFGIFVMFSVFFITGILTRHIVGRKIIAAGEAIVARIPLIRRVYRAVQQIRDTFISRKGAVFQHVCLIEYPRPGMIAVAFVTATHQGLVQHAIGKELLAVFVPTTPNPTSGYLVYLEPHEVTIIDITVEEAMKLIISGRAYIPDYSEDSVLDWKQAKAAATTAKPNP